MTAAPTMKTAARDTPSEETPSIGRDPLVAEEGKRLTDAIQNVFDRFLTAEDALAADAGRDAERRSNLAVIVGAIGIGASAALIILFGVFLARSIGRPVRAVASGATRLAAGEWSLRLPPEGPGEIGELTRAFNDMASTLKGVESRAVALAGEDFSHPQLLVPLPGRTGQALQATIDSLGAIIREREQQRQLLHEAATQGVDL